ncbi:MAG: protein-L-isoaspartate(D-aspartate) O-methyltransferase [Chromatiaceae bacterium]|nr:protein-L-isoaspartate(D-aspartate) O-methyltransferase [Chromatiaceae bacterium]
MRTDAAQMLRDIDAEVHYTRTLIGREAFAPRVMAAMAEVPRHLFVPEGDRDQAYANGPLPIGWGQTISQPYIVALMTDLLASGPGDRVLEIGTGSGYQAAVLSRLVGQVYSLEIIPQLATAAVDRLARLGFVNVSVRQGDGHHGWPEQAPFDGILVTAAARAIPPALVDQLRPGARLVIPVGQPYAHQDLLLLEKGTDGALSLTEVLGVAFVPLTGGGVAQATGGP